MLFPVEGGLVMQAPADGLIRLILEFITMASTWPFQIIGLWLIYNQSLHSLLKKLIKILKTKNAKKN